MVTETECLNETVIYTFESVLKGHTGRSLYSEISDNMTSTNIPKTEYATT